MKKLHSLLFISLCGLLVTSCARDTITPEPSGSTSAVRPENDFIWKGLNSWYYWQKEVPNLADGFNKREQYASFINSLMPDDLFYSLLYHYPKNDRFSWIERDGIIRAFKVNQNAVNKSSGLNYTLFNISNRNRYLALVNYVVPNSPAAKAGIRRGDVLTRVNGSDITSYVELESEGASISVQSSSRDDQNKIVLGEERVVSLRHAEINENPVAFYRVFHEGGRRISYLVYNSFKADFNGELNAIFGKMKQQGVTDLILDLRYNGGGSVNTAVALGQMILGKRGQPYVYIEYNKKHSSLNGSETLKDQIEIYQKGNVDKEIGKERINVLGNLNKVYVLTTQATASASELTIDALKPYVSVTSIGEPTFGKFVGSITLYDDPRSDYTNFQNRNPRHNWKMQPIVFAYWNSRKDPHPAPSSGNVYGGIRPDILVEHKDDFGRIKEFGNLSDPGLAKAFELITHRKYSDPPSIQASVKKRQWKETIPFSLKFVGTNKTLNPLGTDAYLDVQHQK
ncbi:PDZ domain-containing protein [Elizabethkingia argentiflava]|uniref:PDZ domain-containing protein n=1 Tax=Elizabethkingia argenteiflava TaxID=2681556 RepID=A0A845PTU3_9FLAO|nr:S41 family peptidase [Elizabethkingia argenteiflava]NAW51652.1 PDZ domain-containing protein [Elizabethkingia argenteiflava]